MIIQSVTTAGAFLLFVTFYISTSASAAIYHVKRTGSDLYSCAQIQSQATPALTINKALNCIGTASGAGAGHIVRIYGGTYEETINNNMPGGLSWNIPFILESNPGDVVAIRPAGDCAIIVDLRRSATRYVIIQGHITAKMVIDAANCSNNAIKITTSTSLGTAHYIRLKHLEVKNSPNHGIQITANSSFNEQISLWVHHNGSSANTDDTHGTYIAGSHNLVEGGVYEFNYHRGIQIRSGSKTAHRNIIRQTIIKNNGRAPEGSSNVVLAAGDDIMFYNNIVSHATGHGVSISCSGGCPIRTRLYNNTIYKNAKTAINITNSGSPANTDIRNNILWQNGSDTVSLGSSTDTIHSHNLRSDPKFLHDSAYNFRLKADSPAVDKGLSIEAVAVDFDGRARPQGPSHDIGAFEYISTTLPPPLAPGPLTVGSQ